MNFGLKFAAVLTILAILSWLTEPDPDVDWKDENMRRWEKFKLWWRL